jgi:DNA-binding transcriptional ArsR family regulator
MAEIIWATPEDFQEEMCGPDVGDPHPPPLLPMGTGPLPIAGHHFSMMPHEFVDRYVAHLGPVATVIWIYLLRRTRCASDPEPVPLSVIVDGLVRSGLRQDNGTGLGRGAVMRSLERLQELGLVEKKRSRDRGRHLAALYAIREPGPAPISDLRRGRK